MPMPGGFEAVAGIVDTGLNMLNNQIARSDSEDFIRDMWYRNNEYNKPINQVARAREAGVNPYAMLQQGGFNAGNSEQADSVAPAYADFSPGMNSVAALNTSANTRLLNSEASLNEIDAQTQSLKNRREIDNMYKQGLISDEEYKKLLNDNGDFERRRDNDQRAQDDAHDLAEFEKSIQQVTAQYLPDIKEAELNSLKAQSAELFAAARANNAAATNSIAQSMVAKAQEAGLKISNEVAQKTKVALVSEAFAKSREASKRDKIAGEELRTKRGENEYGYARVKLLGSDPKTVSNPYQGAENKVKRGWNAYKRNVQESTRKIKERQERRR